MSCVCFINRIFECLQEIAARSELYTEISIMLQKVNTLNIFNLSEAELLLMLRNVGDGSREKFIFI